MGICFRTCEVDITISLAATVLKLILKMSSLRSDSTAFIDMGRGRCEAPTLVMALLDGEPFVLHELSLLSVELLSKAWNTRTSYRHGHPPLTHCRHDGLC